MGKDRIIIAVCVVLLVALLTGAGSLMPRITQMRGDLQLTANDDVLANLPPEIAFTQVALGSFRGLAVNVLWARVQRMQQKGQNYEAMQLADWLTKLQPRFAAVWEFHAWNMAYNISVTTQTPRERWMWVQAGVRLLRDEAIPLNPNAVLLYRQLGWIYLHKIGQYSDDMHWHYKTRLAQQWHEILGAPPRDGTTEDVLAWFEPVANAYEAYINRRELSFDIRDELEQLRGFESERLRELAMDFRALTMNQLDRRLNLAMAESEEIAEALSPLRAAADEQIAAARLDPVQRLRAGDPEAAAQLDRLREHGFDADYDLIQNIARLETLRIPGNVEAFGERIAELPPPVAWLQTWMQDDAIAEQRQRLLAFTRARVIDEAFNMNPIWMYELMQGDWLISESQSERVPIPIDWRHPGAHGLYWSSLGVRRSQGLLKPDDGTALNTDRQAIHGLQALTRTGDIVLDPTTDPPYFRMMPDPRYIDAHHAALFGATDRIAGEMAGSAAPESLKAGHENFLTAAVHQAYFYGEPGQAERYYRQLRELYSDFKPDRALRYQMPLEDFVFQFFLQDEFMTLEHAVSMVSGMISQAIEQGMANGRREVADRFLSQARRAHAMYQRHRFDIGESHQSGSASRLTMPSYDDMVADTFARFLSTPQGGNPLVKARVWRNAPVRLQRRVYDQVREPLYQQANRAGLEASAMFPEPPGMEEYRQLRNQPEEEQARRQ